MSIAVVVCGYDKYSVMWDAFAHGFNKYWSDCPFPKYFITNHLEAPKGFTTLRTGKEFSWSDKVMSALPRVREDIIVWMMEDFWFPGHVWTDVMMKFYETMVDHHEIDHIRLMCPFNSDGQITPEKELSGVTTFNDKLYHFKKSAEYRASVSASFWQRDVLLSYLRDNMDPWLFENEASALSSVRNTLYLCTVDPRIFPLAHITNPYGNCQNDIMTKGRWTPAAYQYAKNEGIKVNFMIHPNGDDNAEYYKGMFPQLAL